VNEELETLFKPSLAPRNEFELRSKFISMGELRAMEQISDKILLRPPDNIASANLSDVDKNNIDLDYALYLACYSHAQRYGKNYNRFCNHLVLSMWGTAGRSRDILNAIKQVSHSISDEHSVQTQKVGAIQRSINPFKRQEE